MSYPPGSLRSCHEADGRSDRSGGSGGTGSGSGCGNIYGSAFSDCKWHHHQPQLQQQIQSQSPSHQQQQGPSTWQKWAASFDALLGDGEGVALFKSYLVSEGCGNLLDFWFAIQGFRSKVDPSDRKKILQLIKVIYQTYIRGSSSSSTAPPQSGPSSNARSRRTHSPVRLRPETRRAIADRLSHKSSLDQTVFDEAQAEIGHLLRTTAYQGFLKSDTFITHIQGGSKTLVPEEDFSRQYLPTVEEDRELVQQPAMKPGGSVTPATYHYFCGPPQSMMQTQQAPPSQQQCSCQGGGGNPWGLSYYPPSAPQTCYPPAAPLTQENIQMTRFQRAELPVPQHLSCCPHCQTPFQQQNQQQTVQQQQQTQLSGPSNPLSPVQHKFLGRMGSTSGPRKWMDTVCPKYEYCSPPHGGFSRAPPNPYHVSFAPVSMQDSEHHSLSSGAHTEESLSHTDGACDDIRTRMHMASLRHTPRLPTNYPIFEPSATTLTATTTATLTVNPSSSGVFSSHKHKRGSSSSRRAATTSGAVAAATNKTVVATVRDQNLAELDPTGFAKLLNERLQRVVENRAAMERLERIMSEVGNEDEQSGTGVERAEGGESQEVPETGSVKDTTTTATTTTQKVLEVLKVDTETTTELAKVMDNLSVASTPSTSTTAITTTANFKPSVLQRPWADRLLAAARVQHAQQGDNAQAILEDHCSRIWDTSADRTPTSSSGSGGDGTHLQQIRSDALGGKPATSLITQDRDPAPGKCGPSLETQTQEEEEIEDDAIQPPLLQESSSPLSTSNTTNSSSRFDFHQQVAETQLAAELRNQNRCTSSPVASSSSSSGGLVVGYYLCDDPVPYRSQWPSNVITLGQFKHLVPKKGLFRFFFKTTSDEFDSGVVHQEISNDDAVLPLWEGKVVAKVERVEQ
ncbi:unnamed protein product [Hymenolepis diminuta]|uniref:Axin-1 n=1 Tax=Hymenolepis diminuta TaxID=6216 RepID=A0A564YH36_HYMDI|nr:unnamed protein product [Hymenolepis diminuta]